MAASGLSPRSSIWVAIALLLFMSGVALYAAIGISSDASRLAREGVSTTATVVAKGKRRSARYVAGYRSGDSGYHYFTVTYRYTVDGQSIQSTHGIEEARFEALEIGQRVPVRYSPSEPSVSEIDPGWTSSNSLWAGAVASGFAVMASLLLVLVWRMPRPGVH